MKPDLSYGPDSRRRPDSRGGGGLQGEDPGVGAAGEGLRGKRLPGGEDLGLEAGREGLPAVRVQFRGIGEDSEGAGEGLRGRGLSCERIQGRVAEEGAQRGGGRFKARAFCLLQSSSQFLQLRHKFLSSLCSEDRDLRGLRW